jgi:signal recognition particle subunit SEC65
MAIPDYCKELDKKFQEEVNNPPAMPEEVNFRNTDYSSKEHLVNDIKKLAQINHKLNIEYIDSPHWKYPTMFRNSMGQIIAEKYTMSTTEGRDPAGLNLTLRSNINDYAKRIGDAHEAVIKCIKTLPQANRIRQEVGDWSLRPDGPVYNLAKKRAQNDGFKAGLRGGRPTKKSKRRARKTRRRHK